MLKNEVRVLEKDMVIPTYGVGKPEKNPMFLEKRVYQGSSGRVYPHPVTEKIEDEKKDKTYRIIILENEYLYIELMPEIGGRVYRALDKTNQYDFVYYNKVIKPALVGLAGPWISGGIEFNWPQHHRPNTFGPVEYTIEENDDGSKTVWMSEIDRMYGTKGMAGFTLYPSKAYLEIKGQLYNRTPHPQTFLWWANPAIPVNDHTATIFPPDVNAVLDHGKRDVSKFPIATGTYYKMDYSAGVDISRYKNIPVPTSYMAYKSNYDFVGGYDYSLDAGIFHVASRHVSPGKKQWTWGSGEFGKAWDRNLTDEDGPYVELMTGVYTDNQPDFTWIQPYEEKTFKQYFMPYKKVGAIKNASIDAAVNIEVKSGKLQAAVYATSSFPEAKVRIEGTDGFCREYSINLSPEEPFTTIEEVDSKAMQCEYSIRVLSASGQELVSYKPDSPKIEKFPEPAQAISSPSELKNNEALFLAAQHLEQYRHATFEPDPYYLEGLNRDPEDSRINTGYGLLLMQRGLFEESEAHFRKAIATLTRHNPNPIDTEAYYHLGVCLQYQDRLDEAYDVFQKSTWSAAWKDKSYFSLSQIACRKGNLEEGLELVELSINCNYHHQLARHLKTVLLRKLDKLDEALVFAKETIKLDLLDFGARNELQYILTNIGNASEAQTVLTELNQIMRDSPHNHLSLVRDYAAAGFFEEAIEILKRFTDSYTSMYPMIHYYIGYLFDESGEKDQADYFYAEGNEATPDYCFPNHLVDYIVLRKAIKANPKDARALYYLGNLLYDKKRYQDATTYWERSAALDNEFPTVHRNLAFSYFNKMNKAGKAERSLERAFLLHQNDARVFYELDQLYKKTGRTAEARLARMNKYIHLVEQRDDLYVEYVTLLNILNKHHEALDLIEKRKFHPWEGGEGKVTSQFVKCHTGIAQQLINNNKFSEAISYLSNAKYYPENLGEGKLHGTQENDIDYLLGLAYQGLGDEQAAWKFWSLASLGLSEPTNAMYYNDQPPEMIFYQGMALKMLGKEKEAKGRFNKLIDYGENQLFKALTIDYFAVSLPDFLVFDEDMEKKNKVHCYFMRGLGLLGLDKKGEANETLKKVLNLEPCHQGAMSHIETLIIKHPSQTL